MYSWVKNALPPPVWVCYEKKVSVLSVDKRGTLKQCVDMYFMWNCLVVMVVLFEIKTKGEEWVVNLFVKAWQGVKSVALCEGSVSLLISFWFDKDYFVDEG